VLRKILPLLVLLLSVPGLQARYKAVEFRLKNGLRVVCVEKKTSPIVHFSICYMCGSSRDAASRSGVAHYLEHMAMASNKGKSKDFLEDIGAEHNAFTSLRAISFYEIVPLAHVETVFSHEAERMRSMDIDDGEFLGERGAILEERSMRIDNEPNGAAQEALLANLFNREAGGTPIIGWKHEIESIEKKDLYAFHRKWFAPNNAFVVIAGDFDLPQAKALAEKYFGDIAPKKLPIRRGGILKNQFIKEVKYGSQKTGAFSCICYVYGVPFTSKNNFRKSMALGLAIKIMNQPAFFVTKTLKHVLNIVTDVSFVYLSGIYPTDFVGVSISCGSLDDLADSIGEWRYLRSKLMRVGISDGELKIMKRKEMIAQAYRMDDLGHMASHFGWLLLSGYSLQEILSMDEILQSITARECNDVIREVFSVQPMAISKIVPKGYDRE
jgi:zinc protease